MEAHASALTHVDVPQAGQTPPANQVIFKFCTTLLTKRNNLLATQFDIYT